MTVVVVVVVVFTLKTVLTSTQGEFFRLRDRFLGV